MKSFSPTVLLLAAAVSLQHRALSAARFIKSNKKLTNKLQTNSYLHRKNNSDKFLTCKSLVEITAQNFLL